jgi:hypothetical protein
MSLAARLTAIGFALGSAAHAASWVALWWGAEWYGPGYPPWRHVLFALVDAATAWISIRHPRWRVFPLAAFFIDQIVEHGVQPVGVLVMVAAVAAAYERWLAKSTHEAS